MTLVLFKNKLLDSNLDVMQCPDVLNNTIISDILNQVERAAVFYYSANNLLCYLRSTLPDGSLDVSFSAPNPSLQVAAYWKCRNIQSDPTRALENYMSQVMEVTIAVNDAATVEFGLLNSSIRQIRDYFTTNGIVKPDYGVLIFTLSYVGGFQIIYAIKYTDLPLFTLVREPVAPATTRIDYYETPSATFESLYVPTLSAEFVYNFFELNEDDIVSASRRDYAGFNLRDIPRYNKLNWTAAPDLTLEAAAAESATRLGGIMISPSDLGPSVDATIRDSLVIHDGAIITTPPSTGDLPIEVALSTLNTEYIGYVISKEKLDKETGDYQLVDYFIIKRRSQTELIDWKIGYGETYRYKIRSVYQYVNHDRIPIFQDTDSLLTRTEQVNLFAVSGLGSYLYYFDGDFSNNKDVECVEFRRPDFPYKVQIFPNSQKRYICLIWNQKNQNRDVKGFNVYRKDTNKKSFFKKINNDLLEIRHNFFIDFAVEIDQEYIYAIEAVDVHDNFSTLSIQMIAKIIPFDVDLGKNEDLPIFHKDAGRELVEQLVLYRNKDEYTYFKDKFTVVTNPVFAEHESGKTFTLKVLSLDTLQTKQIKIKFNLNTIYHRTLDIREVRPTVPSVTDEIVPDGSRSVFDIGRIT